MKNLLWAIPLVFSLSILSFLFFTNFSTFDYYSHSLFAIHYKESWFSTLEQNVGLVDLKTYPPLAHQLIALSSYILPFELGYSLILLIFLMVLSYFLARFFSEYLSIRDEKFWTTYLIILASPGIFMTTFVFGQSTTIIGLAFGSISLYNFAKFLNDGDKKCLVVSFISLALTAFSHIISFLIIGLFYIFLTLFDLRKVLKNLKVLLPYAIVTLILILSVYHPLLGRLGKNSLIPSKEVLHWSRYIFLTQANFERWASMYGITIFMLALPLFLILTKIKQWKKFLKLYVIALFFFVLGLGKATPLTNIFLEAEHWLTYERFSLMSSLIFSMFFAFFVPNIRAIEISYGRRRLSLITVVFIIFFVFISVEGLYNSHNLFFANPIRHYDPARQEITNYALNFLNAAPLNYRYQTFGYGRPIGEIYLYSKLPTLDTDYFTGRTLEWVKDSGFDEIDQIRNTTFLDNFMSKTEEYSVKFIITFNDFYHQYLDSRNWELVESKNFDGRSVKIWINTNDLKEVYKSEEELGLTNYLRGTVPLITLLIFLTLHIDFKFINLKLKGLK